MRQIPPRSPDTGREAEEVQVRLFRAAPVSRRLHLAWSLSATAMSAARAAIARVDPDATRNEHDLRFVELHHGRELATALRPYLEAHRRRNGVTSA